MEQYLTVISILILLESFIVFEYIRRCFGDNDWKFLKDWRYSTHSFWGYMFDRSTREGEADYRSYWRVRNLMLVVSLILIMILVGTHWVFVKLGLL